MTKTNEEIIEEIKQKSVKERTNQEHQILIKHYGGVRKYLLSMGNFKDVDIVDKTSNNEIIEEVMKEHGMNYDIETSFDKSLKLAIQTALNLKDKEFQSRIQELKDEVKKDAVDILNDGTTLNYTDIILEIIDKILKESKK